jgi:hypothetical protein
MGNSESICGAERPSRTLEAADVKQHGEGPSASTGGGFCSRLDGHAGDGLRHHTTHRAAGRSLQDPRCVSAGRRLRPHSPQRHDGEGASPKLFTHSVNIVTPGKVEEIIPQQIPSGSGELYVVRLTAADSGTEVTIFSTLKGLDRRVKNALSPCKQNAMIAKGGHHAKSADQ